MNAGLFIPPEVGSLEPFVRNGILGQTEVQVVATLGRAADATSHAVLLAAALAVRAPLHGHVCVDLATVEQTVVAGGDSSIDSDHDAVPTSRESAGFDAAGMEEVPLDWPEPQGWLDLVAQSPLATVIEADSAGPLLPVNSGGQLTPLVVDAGRLYLTRYWFLERYVAGDILERLGEPSSPWAQGLHEKIAAEVTRLFRLGNDSEPDPDQLAAALAGVHRQFVVISGGPGTGKTTTVARFLAGLISGSRAAESPPAVALAAPTGKAASRMTESVRHAIRTLGTHLDPEVESSLLAIEATTIHRLLGRRRGDGGMVFAHGPDNPLPHDVVIVDEVSMVSLSLMAHLLGAVRTKAKVVFVGDPFQLASVEAGAVLGDIVGAARHPTEVPLHIAHPGSNRTGVPIAGAVHQLGTVHRQAADSGVIDLAAAIRSGDAGACLDLIDSSRTDLRWVDPSCRFGEIRQREIVDSVVSIARSVVGASLEGDVAKALELIGQVKVLSALRRGPSGAATWNQAVEDALRSLGLKSWSDWYVGRPVMVTKNDYLNHVYNGDVGVAVARDDRFQVCFTEAGQIRSVESTRLEDVQTQWAMTIHKSQGSEFGHVIVSLPPAPSRILTRELLYTAVTRAKSQLTVIATEDSIRCAVERPVTRASGLESRLAVGLTEARFTEARSTETRSTERPT